MHYCTVYRKLYCIFRDCTFSGYFALFWWAVLAPYAVPVFTHSQLMLFVSLPTSLGEGFVTQPEGIVCHRCPEVKVILWTDRCFNGIFLSSPQLGCSLSFPPNIYRFKSVQHHQNMLCGRCSEVEVLTLEKLVLGGCNITT